MYSLTCPVLYGRLCEPVIILSLRSPTDVYLYLSSITYIVAIVLFVRVGLNMERFNLREAPGTGLIGAHLNWTRQRSMKEIGRPSSNSQQLALPTSAVSLRLENNPKLVYQPNPTYYVHNLYDSLGEQFVNSPNECIFKRRFNFIFFQRLRDSKMRETDINPNTEFRCWVAGVRFDVWWDFSSSATASASSSAVTASLTIYISIWIRWIKLMWVFKFYL